MDMQTPMDMQTLLAFRSIASFSQAEFARWVQDVPRADLHRHELLDGFIVREPPAGYPHGEIEARIVSMLTAFVAPRRLGRVFGSSQGFELPTGDTVAPAASFVSKARWSSLTRPVRGFPRVAPDLVVEILSPTTQRIDQVEKRRIYARSGVTEYLWIDPEGRTLTPLRADGSRYRRGRALGVADTFASRVLPGLSIVIETLFPQE